MSGHALAIAIAVVLVAITVVLAAYARRQLRGTTDHYVAGGRLRGWQNGLALAGDQISAGSFLGITGAVALRVSAGSTSPPVSPRPIYSSSCSSPSRCGTSAGTRSPTWSVPASTAGCCARLSPWPL